MGAATEEQRREENSRDQGISRNQTRFSGCGCGLHMSGLDWTDCSLAWYFDSQHLVRLFNFFFLPIPPSQLCGRDLQTFSHAGLSFYALLRYEVVDE